MQDIIEDYIKYTDRDKTLFKEFLNEIILVENSIKENKGKKAINQEEHEENLKKGMIKGEEFLLNEGVTEEDLKGVDMEEMFNKEVLGINNKENETIILFPVYKGEVENSRNDFIFDIRLNILNHLVRKGLIKISDLNIIEMLNNIVNKKRHFDEKMDNFAFDLLGDVKDNMVNKYGESLANKKMEQIKGKEKYFQFLIFERKNITKLLHLIKESEIKEFKYENRALFYGGKPIYPQTEYSDRSQFIELLFSKPKGTYFHLREIYHYIEGGDDYYLDKKQSKKIYNLKDKINSRILTETQIKKLFSLGKGDNKGKIYRLY